MNNNVVVEGERERERERKDKNLLSRQDKACMRILPPSEFQANSLLCAMFPLLTVQ